MFLAVIAGYLVAALFAFCGVYNIINFLAHLDKSAGASVFVNGTALAAWPLAVAAVVYILTRIAILLENQGIITADIVAQSNSITAAHLPMSKRPAAPAPLPSGSYFHATPLTQPQVPIPTAADVPALDEVENIAATAAEEAEKEAAAPEKKAPSVIKRRNDGLNFFRVD